MLCERALLLCRWFHLMCLLRSSVPIIQTTCYFAPNYRRTAPHKFINNIYCVLFFVSTLSLSLCLSLDCARLSVCIYLTFCHWFASNILFRRIFRMSFALSALTRLMWVCAACLLFWFNFVSHHHRLHITFAAAANRFTCLFFIFIFIFCCQAFAGCWFAY